MSIQNTQQIFVEGRPSGVSNVVRDAIGNLTNWIENGFSMAVYRDSAGYPLRLVASRGGMQITQFFTFSGGQLVTTSGVNIPTAFAQELMTSAPKLSTFDPTDKHVYTLMPSDIGKNFQNTSNLPMWIFIPKGLGTNFSFTVTQRGRGRVYVCPGSGVELNGVVGVGRWSTCRRGQSIAVTCCGVDAFSANVPRHDVVHSGPSDYATIDATGATYTLTGDLVTVTHTGHGFTSALNGKSVYMMVATGPLYSWIFDNFTYVDANTYTLKAPSALPASKGTLSGTMRATDGNGLVTNLVNAPNTILIGGSGATYSVTGDRITVTWTGHGLTNAYNGANVHMTFTGQSLATGVYRNFLYVDANTFEVKSPTFFAATSTGSLTANTAETMLLHHVVPGDAAGDGGSLRIITKHTHLANANTKSWRVIMGRHGALNGSAIRKGQSSSTTTSTTEETFVYRHGPAHIDTHGGTGTELSFGPTTVATQRLSSSYDLSADQTIKFTAQVAVATDWVCLRTAVIEADRGRNVQKVGVGTQIGLNLGALGSGTKPGTPYVDYTGTSLAQYQRWASKGIKLFRLGFLWERVQQSLSGPLDGPATAIITEQLDFAASVGGKILLDVHNYMKYNGVLIGSGPTQADLVDLWTKLATLWKNHPGVYGWGLMNEPNSGLSISTLNTIQQAVINGIRAVDTDHPITVQGINGSMSGMMSTNEQLRPYDPANNLLIEAHVYPDAGYGGVVTNYVTDAATFNSSVVTQPQGVMGYSQVVPYAVAFYDQYLRQQGMNGIVGEFGVAGNDDRRWMSENFSYGLAAMASRGLPVFLWSAGGGSTGSQTYPFSIEPLLATPDTDRPQWEFIEPFVRAFNF